MNAEEFTYDQERLYDALVRSTDDYIFLCNLKQNVFYFPQSMVEEFALPGQLIEDASSIWVQLIHENDRSLFIKAFQDILEGSTNVHNVEYRVKNRRGEWIWLRCRGYLEHDERGEPTLFAGMISNLGKRNKIDHLTGLFNKFEMETQLNNLLAQPGKRGGLMILDLDGLHHINDLYSREFGDEVIRIYSQKIQSHLPSNATVYRLDGDEFGVIVENAGPGEIRNLYRLLQREVAHQQEYNGQVFYCTMSGGCALFPEDSIQFASLYQYAEYSLEYAKSNGKNRLSFFSREIMEKTSRSLMLIEQMRWCVEHNFAQFNLYYQPQVYAKSRMLKGAEALLRWECEQFGAVSPVEFVPLLEQTGLITQVGKWVFYQAAKTCLEWVAVVPSFVMTINFSYLQLRELDFIAYVSDVLDEIGLDPSHIVIEVTESCIAAGSRSLADAFMQIRGAGIRIAMDDFGTGYSSLEILKNAPADIVKIDRVFVKDILTSTFDATFIRFIVALCHDVGIEICLEGVENKAEYDLVSTMQLDYIQGYLFGRPQEKQSFYNRFITRAAQEISG